MRALNPEGFYIVPKRVKFAGVQQFKIDPSVLEALHVIEALAMQRGINIISDEKRICNYRDPIIVTVGGDGTALQGFRIASDYKAPVITVNLGRLGFLADINPKDVGIRIGDILNGEYVVEERMLLQDELGQTAANEFYISHSSRGKVFHYSVYVDDVLASKQAADGVIIGTPTGSTAYSLAAGGAILSPSMKAIQIVPVAPHSLTSRALIVSHKSKIRIDTHGGGYKLKADGKPLKKDTGITFSIHPRPIKILHPESWNFYSVLSNKLKW